MGKIINLILVTIVVLYNVIRAQEEEDSICKGEVPSVDPDQCCKIPIMVDEQFRDKVLGRVDEYVRRGEANKAVCKACHHVLQDLKILNEEGNIDLDVAIRFFYESLPDHKSLAEVWRVAATDCYEWIKDHHSDQYQAEHGFPKEDCDVKSEVLIFCTTTRVTANCTDQCMTNGPGCQEYSDFVNECQYDWNAQTKVLRKASYWATINYRIRT